MNGATERPTCLHTSTTHLLGKLLLAEAIQHEKFLGQQVVLLVAAGSQLDLCGAVRIKPARGRQAGGQCISKQLAARLTCLHNDLAVGYHHRYATEEGLKVGQVQEDISSCVKALTCLPTPSACLEVLWQFLTPRIAWVHCYKEAWEGVRRW